MTATLPPYARLCTLAENVGAQAWRATTKSIITGEVSGKVGLVDVIE